MRPPRAFWGRVGLGVWEAQVLGDALGPDVIQRDMRSLHFAEEPPAAGDDELLGPCGSSLHPGVEAVRELVGSGEGSGVLGRTGPTPCCPGSISLSCREGVGPRVPVLDAGKLCSGEDESGGP
eukprot:2136428-Alexandrium_andersonii.AAC.1